MAFKTATILVRMMTLAVVAGLVSGCGASSGSSSALGNGALGVSEATSVYKPASGKKPWAGKTQRASAHKAVLKLTSVAKPGSNAYKVGPLDVLAISVFKVSELSKSVQVSDGGTINLPLVGEVAAAGRTAREIERDLKKKWGAKYLQNPQVTVFVKEYNSQRITVEGAVKKPGVFPIRGRMTLIQAIATVGGLSTSSDSTVLVFRDVNGKRQAARFNVADIRSGAADDPRLKAGDVVVAGTSAVKATFNNIMKALPLASVFALL